MTAGDTHSVRVDSFLRKACPDWRLGGPERARQMHSASRLLRKYPELARDSIYTAVVCGQREQVERILAERPAAAAEPGGPHAWPPLLYLCNARLAESEATEDAVPIARMLLDRGADPNAYYPGGNPAIRYTALTCVMGRGEEQAAIHPRARALVEILMARGGEPYDMQVRYNVFAGHASQRHLTDEAVWLMDLTYERALALGREADWKDPDWTMLGMGGYGCGARFLVGSAISAHHMPLMEWLLSHGANPNAPPAPGRNAFQGSLYDQAVRRGLTEMSELLVRYGATPSQMVLDDADEFTAACLGLNSAKAKALIGGHPDFLQMSMPMRIAAETDRADVAAFLIDHGMSADVEDVQHGGARPLHAAAYHDSLNVAQLLIGRGAEIDPYESNYGATPFSMALWGQKPRMVELLSPLSRDVWSLTTAGKLERLREVLNAEPRLAKVTYENQTPLFWLPEDEAAAAAIVELFLAHGADPALKNKTGQSAGDLARERGLDDAARLLTGV